MPKNKFPFFGLGLSYRYDLDDLIFKNNGLIDIVEVMPEHFINVGDTKTTRLKELSEMYKIILHSVSLSVASSEIGSRQLRRSIQKVKSMASPVLISDHITISNLLGTPIPSLLPVPHTRDYISLISKNIRFYKEQFNTPMAFENITREFSYEIDMIEEADFLNSIISKSDCYLLLDLTNLYINSMRYKYDPYKYLKKINVNYVAYIHLSGGEYVNGRYIDSHSQPIPEPVWKLYEFFLELYRGPVNTILERDDNLGKTHDLLADISKARLFLNSLS